MPTLEYPTPTPADPMRAPTQASGIKFAVGTPGFYLHWPCTFHVVCAAFFALGMRTLPNVNVVSGGIQALGLVLGVQ